MILVLCVLFFSSPFGHMHGALNVVKEKKLIAQFGCTRQDESFESN